MYCVFYSTSDVFEAEERLKNQNVECNVVPTPVTDKAYCGVCIQTEASVEEILKGMEYRVIS